MGLGHLERLLALADTLRESIPVVFVLDDDDRLRRRVELRGHDVVVISADTPARALQSVATVPDAAAVVLDGYRFDDRLQATIRENCRVVVIDDTDQPACADIAVNPSPATDGPGPEGADRWLRGADYALISNPYLEAREDRIAHPPGSARILVAVGGADTTGSADALVRAALESGAVTVDAVVGPMQRALGLSAPNLVVHEQPASLARLMATATMYVGAAGTTAVQAACVGLPSVVFPVVGNQVPQARRLEAAGCAAVLPMPFEPEAGESLVRSLLTDPGRRDAMADSGRNLVDGQGCARLASAIEALL